MAKKAQDEAQLANARLDLERYERLAATNSIARQQLDTQKATVAQLEAQVKLDQAQIDNAKAILDYTTITAPIDGRTGIRLVDEGNIVRASDTDRHRRHYPVAADLDSVHACRSSSSPKSTARLPKAALPVEAFGADNKTVIDRGVLQVVDNQVDQTTGTIRLKAEFPNRDLQLWPGQFVNVQLLIDTLRQVVVAPTAAVQRGPNGTFVFVVQPDNKVAVRPVTVAQQDETQAVILSGLQADERVVTTGFARLTAGSGGGGHQCRDGAAAERGAAARSAARTRPRGANGASGGPTPRRARRDERLDALHPPPYRNLAPGVATMLGGWLGYWSLPVSSLPQVDFPTIQVTDPVARRQPRHGGVAGDGAARAPVRPDPVAHADDLAELASASARSRCSSISTATSTAPRRTCRRRSTRRGRRCRAIFPIRRPTPR